MGATLFHVVFFNCMKGRIRTEYARKKIQSIKWIKKHCWVDIVSKYRKAKLDVFPKSGVTDRSQA